MKKTVVILAFMGLMTAVGASAADRKILSENQATLTYPAKLEVVKGNQLEKTFETVKTGEQVVMEEGKCFRETVTLVKMQKIDLVNAEIQIPIIETRRDTIQCPS